MASFVSEAMECTEKCRSIQHGQAICAIATQGTDVQVLSLWKSTCLKFYKIKDEFGRSAIHMAASTGRSKVIEWLVKKEGCDVNTRDLCGLTPLSRSIYFGHIDCARTLIRLDASLAIGDNEGYFPLDLVQLDGPALSGGIGRDLNELYVWGSNENYNLGTGSEQPKANPELLDKFKKLSWGHVGSCFLQVVFERYHTLFLHWSRQVYSCGYGVGGRLGLGNEYTAFNPTKVDLGKDTECVKIAAGPDHSLFLLSTGVVKSCGLNEYSVLGQNHAMNKVFQPKHVDVSAHIVDVAASRYHSVFLAEDNIYICGTNVGQMLKADSVDKIVKPIKVNFQFEIETKSRSGEKFKFTCVSCTESATAISHSGGNIFILKNYECTTLNTRHIDIQKIQLVGGTIHLSWNKDKLSHSENEGSNPSASKLAMFVLISTGRLLIWRDGIDSQSALAARGQSRSNAPAQFNLAVFGVGRALTIVDFSASLNSILLVNHTGEGFRAPWNPGSIPVVHSSLTSSSGKSSKSVNEWSYVIQQSARHSTGKDPLANMKLETIKAKRIPNIFKAIAAFSDPKGSNFGILQRHQKADQIILPIASESEICSDFKAMLNEASCEDCIHDVVFQVRKSLFPSHRYVIASRAPKLYDNIVKELNSKSERAPRVTIADVEPRVFEQILQYLYTNSCDLIIPGKFVFSPNDPDWLDLLKSYSRKLGLIELQKRLKGVVIENGINMCSNQTSSRGMQFNWNSFPEFYDVELITDDGVHARAHLCVLVARLEYFKSMLLSNFWLEGTKAEKRLRFPSSKAVMELFMQLIYEGSSSYQNNGTKQDLEILSQALIASDLLLSQQYRSVIECLLAECINLETVGEIIQLAEVCNAPQIKDCCLDFMSQNLAALLENRYLDSIPEDMVQEISRYYREKYVHIISRQIKNGDAPSIEAYKAAEEKYAELFQDLDCISSMDYSLPRKQQQNKGKVKLRNRARTLSSCSNQEDDEGNYSGHLDDLEIDETESPVSRKLGDSATVLSSSFEDQKGFELPNIQEVSNKATPRIKIPMPSKTFKLPQSPVEKHTPLTQKPVQVQLKPGNVSPLSLSDFPSFDDVYKKGNGSAGGDTVTANIENSPPKREKPQLGATPPTKDGFHPAATNSAASGSSRRKTKWVSLEKASTSPKPQDAPTPGGASKDSSGRDPKNPWQRLHAPGQIQSPNGQLNFDEILQQEQQKKENLRKALEKPLHLSQIEDEAINQLLKRYTSQDVIEGYETLTVERVSISNEYAIPVWRKVNDNPLE